MINEIKEILEDYKKLAGEITEKLDNTAEYENWLIIQDYFDKLLDYITNLQEENERLKELVDCDDEQYDIQESIISRQKEDLLEKDKLLNILQGSEKPKEIIDNGTMINVNNKNFHCSCGANVFTRYSDNTFECNGCGNEYEGSDKE